MALRWWSLVAAGLWLGLASAKLTENRKESKQLQKALSRDQVVIVIDGILDRILGEPSPDPLALINFPDIDTQFKVHVLEDSRKIKLALAQQDDVWCQDIELGSEVELTRQRRKDDHLVLVFDQRFHDPKITAHFACLGKGQFEMSKSLRSLKQEMPYSKVKLYHPKDVEVEVYSKKTGEEVLATALRIINSADWRLERQTDNCHSVQDIQADFHMYASYELCVWENIGWYNLSNGIDMMNFTRYQEDIDSLAPQVSDQLQWNGMMGDCWHNSTQDIFQYFNGCDYSEEDASTLYNIIYAWSDMTCFSYVFNDACSSYLRGEIYYYFSQAYTNSYDTYNSYDYTTYTK